MTKTVCITTTTGAELWNSFTVSYISDYIS